MMLAKQHLMSRPEGCDHSLFDLSQGNGDIPDVDEEVTGVWRTVMGDGWDEEEFRLCYQQLFINGKSLADIPGVRGTGLYLLFSVLNHSCLANTVTWVCGDTGKIQVRAGRRILAGEEITARYGGLNLGQPRRQQLLFDHWRFSCTCARCSDPTELGTFNSGLVCGACPGYLVPHRHDPIFY